MDKHSKSLLFINVHPLRSHHDQLCCQLETLETKPAVIAVCETWITDSNPIDMYFITGYQPIIVKNRNDKRGGGVGFFVRDDCKLISTFFFEGNLEHLLLTIENGKKRINFCVLYRPPSEKIQTFFETFESLLFNINAMKEETIICGDFNIDISDTYHQQYKNVINSFNYELQNAEPTRVTKITSKCIDHILSKQSKEVSTLKWTFSDHDALLFEFDFSVSSSQSIEFYYSRNFKFFEIEQNYLNFLFISQHRLNKKTDYDLESSWCELSSVILQVFDDKCPITKKKIFKNSWMANRLKNLISKRDRPHDTLISHPNSKNKVRFNQFGNLVIEVRNAHKQHYGHKLSLSGSPAQNFKLFNEFLGQRKKSVIDFAVEEFNHFFINLGKKVSNTIFHNVESEPGLPCHDKTFFLFPVDTKEIFIIISSLENKSTAGHDGISNKHLTLVASVVSYHVAKIIIRSFQEGFFSGLS